MDGEASGFALNIKELADHCVDGSPSPKVMIWCGSVDPAEGLRYADGLYKKGISFELSWTSDKDTSMKTARLRKYKYWADFSTKTITNLINNQTYDLANFDSEASSC
jgi:ATP phosphoribosyltransferase regulatory subunit